MTLKQYEKTQLLHKLAV